MSRIAATALLVLVAAGCGGGTQPQKVDLHGVPSPLAHDWAGQASAISAAAAAGNDCRAQALAVSLRNQVMQKQHLLPLRLRSPLVTGLDSLVERTTCRETVVVTTTPGPPHPHGPPPHKPPHKPTPPGHGHGHDHGHGDDQGDQGGGG